MARGSNKQKSDREQRRKEAQRILNRVERESEQVGTSSMARTANKVRDHFLGEDTSQNDRTEIIGKRIARILAALAVVALAVSLFVNYIMPQ